MPTKHIVVTHYRPQVSDLGLIWLLKKFGCAEDYAHIEDGLRIRYVRDGGRGLYDGNDPSRLRENARITYSGVGRGEYDEHGKDILECEVSLRGRDLGLIRDWHAEDNLFSREEQRRHAFSVPDKKGGSKTFFVEDANLRDIFAAVVRDDINGSPPFSFGNLVDSVYGCYPQGMQRAMNFAHNLMEASYAYGAIPRDERETAHREAIDLLLGTVRRMERLNRFHPYAFLRVRGWLGKRLSAIDFEPLNLIDAVAVLKRAGAHYRRWMVTAVRSELTEQHQFHTTTAAEAAKARLRPVVLRITDGGREYLERRMVAVVETDDPQAHKYLFSAEFGCDAALVIRKNSRGQVQIYPGGYRKEVMRKKQKSFARVSLNFLMPAVSVLIRVTECRNRRVFVPAWDELVSDHGPQQESTWFFYSKPGWLLNGSLTATDVPPSSLPLQEIEDVAVWAIDDSFSVARKIVIQRLGGGRR